MSTLSQAAPQFDPRRYLTRHHLLHPSTVILLVANLLPLGGVIFKHWDPYLLLVLYWMETFTIGLWTLARIAIGPADGANPLHIDRRSTMRHVVLVISFVGVSGIFMALHFVLLWKLFAGDWAGKIHGVNDFADQVVVRTGMWTSVAGLFVSRGVVFLFHDLRPDMLRRAEQAWFGRWLHFDVKPSDPRRVVTAYFCRVAAMQGAVIFGATLSFLLGSLAPILVLIGVKIVVDLTVHVVGDMGHVVHSLHRHRPT